MKVTLLENMKSGHWQRRRKFLTVYFEIPAAWGITSINPSTACRDPLRYTVRGVVVLILTLSGFSISFEGFSIQDIIKIQNSCVQNP